MLKKTKSIKTTFIFDRETEDQVYLVGDFNNWEIGATPLEKKEGNWEVTLDLSTGKFAYKYFANNSWHNDPEADEYRMNQYGQEDSVVSIVE